MGKQVNIAIFASGRGSNAINLIKKYSTSTTKRVKLLLTNRVDNPLIEECEKLGVESIYFSSKELYKESSLDKKLKEREIDLIILAGFLLKIPERLLTRYPDKIINIHPSLLPKDGGKGMYGAHVHQAVLDAGESESGITIHLANNQYDQGRILFQERVAIEEGENVESLSAKIQQLEWRHFPEVVSSYIDREILKR